MRSRRPRSYQRAEAFTADPMGMARHALKVMLTFTLLERRQLPLNALPDDLDNIRVYREYNRGYFRLVPPALAKTLVSQLERSGAVSGTGDFGTGCSQLLTAQPLHHAGILNYPGF